MPTFTDLKLKSKFDTNFKEIWNAITSIEVPKGRQIGNQDQRDNIDRVYNLYLILHNEFHKSTEEIGPQETNQENYQKTIVQAFHAQPYQNLPKFKKFLHTGFVSKEAEKAQKKRKKPTPEHVYPRNMTLRLDLLEPKAPLTFKEFIYHYISKGGLYSYTTATENRALRNYHKKKPKAIMSEHWLEIYKKCSIVKAKD